MYVECKYPPFSTVAQKVHDAGGIVSLAHPAEYGLEAIEVIHPSQDSIYSKKLQDIAIRNNLAFTGGSNFHGGNDNGMDLGMGGENMMTPDSFWENLF